MSQTPRPPGYPQALDGCVCGKPFYDELSALLHIAQCRWVIIYVRRWAWAKVLGGPEMLPQTYKDYTDHV